MTTSTIIDRLSSLLATTPPFDALTESERASILSDVSIQYYGPGEVIVPQGTMIHPGLYIVESGLVRLMDVSQQRLLHKVGEGDVFGSFGLLKGGATIYEAKAVEPTVCALLKGQRFQQLYESSEDFAAYFDSDLRMYVRRMGSTMDVTGSHLLFSRNLNQFTHRRPVTCHPEFTAQRLALLMKSESVDSVVVMQNRTLAGIVTNADLRDRVVARGVTGDTPVKKIMRRPVVTMSVEASLFDAMMQMLTRRVHRLVLVDGDGMPVGILTDRDISHFRGQDPVATTSRIESASSVDELVGIRASTNEELLNLYRQGAQPEMLNRIMMVFYDRLAVRVLQIVEQELRGVSGDDGIHMKWAWMRLGSGGRQEMALNSEQHNALIIADQPTKEAAERAEKWFNRLAERANEALAACGFNPSEFVARDERWRKSFREWKRAYREWILQADEDSLAPTPLFFDLRGIYGDVSLVEALKQDIVDALNVQELDDRRTFFKLMAQHAMESRPPTGLLRKMLDRVAEGRNVFDVREGGIRPIVDAARVLALEVRYFESTNTFDRLRQAAIDIPELSKVIDDALEAYQYLVDFRLESQLHAVEAGDQPVNQIEAAGLNKMQQRLLKNAFSGAADLQDALARRYKLGRKWLSREQLRL